MFNIIRYRLNHYKNILGVLLLGMCLATGFFALQSLYLHQVSEATARAIVEDTRQERLNLTLSNPQPLDTELDNILRTEVGDLTIASYRYNRTLGHSGGPTLDQICGYQAGEDGSLEYAASTSDNCYTVYAFQSLTELFTLAEGRYPANLETPSDSELPLIEGVISTEIATNTGVGVGDEIIVGDDLQTAVTMRIVGIVEPVASPDYELWNGNHIVLSGVWTPVGDDQRYDYGIIVPFEDYVNTIVPLAPSVSFLLWSEINREKLTANQLETLNTRLDTINGQALLLHSDISLITGLRAVIQDYQDELASLATPILALSTGILILLLFNLVTTATLILEQQKSEWAAYALRGASIRQLLLIQFITMGIMGVVAGGVGPLVATAILSLMDAFGEINTTSSTSIISGISPRTFVLSFAAALAAVVVLTIQAYPTAKNSLSQVKSYAARPNAKPVWMQYFLDLLLIVIGVGFLLRLYFLISGDLGESLRELLQDPSYLVRVIASEGESRNMLDDPFNLAGVLLLLTGIALLWLRIFPLMMRFLNWLWRRQDSLPVTLALWNVERNPNHYAQLVLMLIGILALGTASLSLTATHDRGAWEIASEEVGADARIHYELGTFPAEQDWVSLPDVTSAQVYMRLDTRRGVSTIPTTLMGVDADTAKTLEGLRDLPEFSPGILLPEDTAQLHIQIYPEATGDIPTQTNIELLLINHLGVAAAPILMTTNDNSIEGQFIRYQADIPDGTWHLVGFQFLSRRGDETVIPQTVYLDDITAVSASGEETMLEDFEAEGNIWGGAIGDRNAPVITLTTIADSTNTLKLDYTVRNERLVTVNPLLVVNQPEKAVPVLISREFAIANAGRGGITLEAGDTGVIQLDLPLGITRLPYVVTGVVDTFSTLTGQFLIVPFEPLVYSLNSTTPAGRVYDWNEVWLDLQNDEPSPTLSDSIGEGGEIRYAWDRYEVLKQDALINAITRVLFAGFWVALALGALDFAFYLTLTVQQRAVSFAVLRAMGWQRIGNILLAEQVALITPALVLGVSLGILLAYLLLPFMTLIGSHPLQFPVLAVMLMIMVYVVVFSLIGGLTSQRVSKSAITDILRQEDMRT